MSHVDHAPLPGRDPVDSPTTGPDERKASDWIVALRLLLLLTVPMVATALLGPAALPAFWIVYLLSVAVLPIGLWLTWDRPAAIVTALVAWFALHKLLIAVLSSEMPPQAAAWLQNYKEVMYLGVLAIGTVHFVGRMRREGLSATLRLASPPDILGAAFVALVAIYFLLSLIAQPDDLRGQLTYARRFASLPLLFLAGRLLLPDRRALGRSIHYLVGIAAGVALFGLVERLVLGDAFWTDFVRVGNFLEVTISEGFGSARSRLVDGIPANWISFLDGTTIRRLVGTFLEPTTLALFLALALGFAVWLTRDWRSGRRLAWAGAVVAIALALVLTLGKGGIVAATVIAFVVLARTARGGAWRVAVVVAGGAAVALWVGQYLPMGDNLSRHVAGLLSGLTHVVEAPLGSGLGSTGFWGERLRVANDSTMGAVASQVGVAGILLYTGWMATAAWRLLPASRGVGLRSQTRRVLAGAVIALLVVGFVSNSTSGLLAGAFYVLMAGWTMTTLVDDDAPEGPDA